MSQNHHHHRFLADIIRKYPPSMPEDDLPIGIGELAFCLGVDMIGTENTSSSNDREKSNFDIIVHLLRLDDPHSVISRKKRAEEHFAEGKWYRQSAVGPKVYTQIDDIVPTGPAKADGKAKTFELILPVFFAPDLSAGGLDQQLGQVPRLKDQKFAGIPICPLFGDEASNCLPEVCWMQGSYFYSSELYELKTSLSFFKGIHTWKSPQCVDQLSPWNYEKYPAIGRISTEPSFTGIVVEQFTRTLQLRGPAIQFCVVLNKEAELALAMNPEGRAASLGEYREYLPMKLDCYDMPLLIALNRPQSHRGHEQQMFDTTDLEIQLQKRGQLFEFTLLYTSKRFTNVHTACYLFPWLGKVYDPFFYLDDYESHEKEEEKRRISLKLLVRPNWHLPKGSVAWFVDGFGGGEEVQQADDGDENVISQSSPTTLAPVHGNNAGSGFGLLSQGAATSASYHHQMGGAYNMDISDAESDDAAFQLEESPSNNNIPESRELDLASPASSILNLDSSGDLELVETAIATFMTVSTWCGNDCAFLFWDADSGTFTRKCYAKFDSSLNFDGHSPGEWFELKYTQNADKENRITVYAFAHAQEQTETKFTNGICAQYRYVTNRDRFVSVWHACYPCPEKSSYYTDRGWWPWLCKKCFPDLPEVPQTRTSPIGTSPTSTCQQTEPRVDHPTEGGVLFSTRNAVVTAAAKWEVENTDSQSSSSPDNELAEFAENMKCSMNMSSSSMEFLEGSNAGSMSYRSSNSKVSSTLSLQSSNSNEQKKQSNKSPPAASVKEEQEQEKENAEREKERKKKQTSISTSSDETSFSSRLLRSAIGDQQALAVLMTVREDRGDSVFLLYDDGKRKFVNRVYADLPEKIPGHPRIGSWYWLEYKSVALYPGQKITVLSVIEEPSAPVTTRIERIAGYTLAQFNTKERFMAVWHVGKLHKYTGDLDWWWPVLCLCNNKVASNDQPPSAPWKSYMEVLHGSNGIGSKSTSSPPDAAGTSTISTTMTTYDFGGDFVGCEKVVKKKPRWTYTSHEFTDSEESEEDEEETMKSNEETLVAADPSTPPQKAEEVYVPSRFVTDLLGAGALLLSSSSQEEPSLSAADDQAVRPPPPPSQPVPAATNGNGIVRRAEDEGSRRPSPTSSSLSGSTSGASQTAADQRQQGQQNDAASLAVTVQPVPPAAALLANGAAPEPAAAESNLANGHDDPLIPLPALNGGFGSARLRRQARDECMQQHHGKETSIRRQQQV